MDLTNRWSISLRIVCTGWSRNVHLCLETRVSARWEVLSSKQENPGIRLTWYEFTKMFAGRTEGRFLRGGSHATVFSSRIQFDDSGRSRIDNC
jgi:hypothetical protein